MGNRKEMLVIGYVIKFNPNLIGKNIRTYYESVHMIMPTGIIL